MKKLVSVLLVLSLLLSLSLTAAADGDAFHVAFGGVSVTATGYSAAPGADGTPRLTLFLRAENSGESACELRCASCQVGPCELPANLSLHLDPGERAETELVVPLTALRWFDLSSYLTDYVRLRFALYGSGAETRPLFSDWLLLRVGALSRPDAEKAADAELFARFGARIRSLGVVCDEEYLTAWLLLENNNDFPLAFSEGPEEVKAFHYALCGGFVQAHSRAAFRVDIPLEKKPMALSLVLSLDLRGCADGETNDPVKMAMIKLPLRLEEAETGAWTLFLSGECEPFYDQSYIARVGMREFGYSESEPVFEVDPDMRALPERTSALTSLACCAGYEVLAGAERSVRDGAALTALPLILRNFTGEALALTLEPSADALWLPCLTVEPLRAGANGSAGADWLFDAGGLAYTELAGQADIPYGFTLLIRPEGEQVRSYGEYPAELRRSAAGIIPAEPCAFEETALGELSFRLLGMDLSDGLSLWLTVRNDTDADQAFDKARLDAMLNSAVISLFNSGTLIPPHTECLVLLRGAVYPEDGGPDFFAFRKPQLTELNTLKLRLGPEDGPETMSLMFQRNGTVMFASVLR